jgi:acetolactate synthase small subunit
LTAQEQINIEHGKWDRKDHYIKTVNSPSILQRILQIIKRRRINIRQFTAQERDKDHGFVRVEVDAGADQGRLLAA